MNEIIQKESNMIEDLYVEKVFPKNAFDYITNKLIYGILMIYLSEKEKIIFVASVQVYSTLNHSIDRNMRCGFVDISNLKCLCDVFKDHGFVYRHLFHMMAFKRINYKKSFYFFTKKKV